MFILGQKRDLLVNMSRIHALHLYELPDIEDEKYRILAWFGTTDEDCWGLGDYETEERAKEVLRDIWQMYGRYLHRDRSPAILRGTLDISEMLFVPPKIYEMPEI